MYRHGTTRLFVVDNGKRPEDFLLGDVLETSTEVAVLEAPDNGFPGSMRLDLIARVRQEIEAGTYDTPEKWDAALDRLADSFGLD